MLLIKGENKRGRRNEQRKAGKAECAEVRQKENVSSWPVF